MLGADGLPPVETGHLLSGSNNIVATTISGMAKANADSARPYVPETTDWKRLALAARRCRGCELYRDATQTVFGEGPKRAPVMLLGEQPGDQEDRQGQPFVGPAGHLLDRALIDAGIDRTAVYVSNVVKHFRFIQKGKLRFHQKPSGKHIRACRPWLEAEVASIKPEVIVCLGATAAQSVFEKPLTVTSLRGQVHSRPLAQAIIVTVHPSSLLRTEDEAARHAAYAAFVADLKLARQVLK